MATTSGKKKNGRSSGTGRSNSNQSASRGPARAQRNGASSRYIVGAILGIVGLLSVITYFHTSAIVINWLRRIIGGLFGWGYYLVPPALLMSAYLLQIYHKGPIGGRLTCTLLVPLFFGALTEMLFSSVDLSTVGGFSAIVSLLYSEGQQLIFGGVLSGLLSYFMVITISVYAGAPILILAFLYCLLMTVNVTPSKINVWLQNTSEKTEARAQERKIRKAEIVAEREKQTAEEKQARIAAQEEEQKRAAESAPSSDEGKPESKTANPMPPIETIETPVLAEHPGEEKKQDAKAPMPEITLIQDFNKDYDIPVEEQAKKASSSGPEPVFPAGQASNVELSEVPKLAAGDLDLPVRDAKPDKALTAEPAGNAQKAAAPSAAAFRSKEEEYAFPPLDLLRKGPAPDPNAAGNMEEKKQILVSTIESFGVGADLTDITVGPTVTRYDFELQRGVKLSKFTSLSNDIALALGAPSARIAPIPNKISTVGVEVPNAKNQPVYLRDLLDTDRFRQSKSKLSFALGKNISGETIIGDIAKLPHLLIAGTTGSGKSVCMNSLIISLLYKARPDEVKLIMIDPKMVELGVYNGIPHLYVPVVTDPKKATGALQWSVVEMLKRYTLFSEDRVRDLKGYNANRREKGEQILPQVVIVIDELADLMMAASKDVENSIVRIAQMGRAAGMHLVIATQRPSADVITGLMKANIPSRIAFAVSSAMESRIILDQSGAEMLIGMGDMLYCPIGISKPTRIQGSFVSDEEREQVIEFIKEHCSVEEQADYSEEIASYMEKASEETNGNKQEAEAAGTGASDALSRYDELLPQAVDVIFDSKQASVSMLQRRLKLGYSRAARIVDQLEELGVVGPFEGSKPRQILITREQWQEMQMLQGTAPTEQLADLPEDLSDIPDEENDGEEDDD